MTNPTYTEYCEYIRFASIHPQVLVPYLAKEFKVTQGTAQRAVEGMRRLNLIYGDGSIVILTDEGRTLCDQAELHRTGKEKI